MEFLLLSLSLSLLLLTTHAISDAPTAAPTLLPTTTTTATIPPTTALPPTTTTTTLPPTTDTTTLPPTTTTTTTTTPIPGTIDRTTKQQILSTIPPTTDAESSPSPPNPDPFLTSPSGKYAAYFLRHVTAPNAGGFGNDFCFVQVKDTSTGNSVWESECAPVSNVNTCTLTFTDAGLEIFDGSRSSWDTSVDGQNLEVLELVDEGDMRIRDKDGNQVWRASDNPRVNQVCGLAGSPGLSPAKPPFAAPIGGSTRYPFGQQQGQGQQQQGLGLGLGGSGVGQAQASLGLNGGGEQVKQPLVDNTPYDSGYSVRVEWWVGVGVAGLLALVG
ncbi:hypothetical protein QJS10_CPB15g00477 [Acorus calamus]|uniref:Bulb-type lectin domain-containing protein n=1 Tax=Acorus calamus TaxID=4465 RepID=A0AAV9D919_ACOCL|nr:hypothetical protein QJS10_CPB15g00477 [Acorus calamus]